MKKVNIPNKKILAAIIACCILGFFLLFVFGSFRGFDWMNDSKGDGDVIIRDIKNTRLEAEKVQLDVERAMFRMGCIDAKKGMEPRLEKSEGYLKGHAACKVEGL